MENQLEKKDAFSNSQEFEHAQRVAKMLSTSTLVPKEYQNNIQNTLIALEMANRIGANPMMVMQNLYIVHGKPSWSSTFIIASINSCGKFSPLRFEKTGDGDDFGCTAWAYDKDNGEKLEGPKVTMKMVKAEGWDAKNGSKWKTMPELMFMYRAAAFFGRLYAPEVLMGMLSTDEIEDIQYEVMSSRPLSNKPTLSNDDVVSAIAEKLTLEQVQESYTLNDEQIKMFEDAK